MGISSAFMITKTKMVYFLEEVSDFSFFKNNFLKGLKRNANAETITSPTAIPICEIIPNKPGSI
jgi:hypothetical protein